ncbi:S-layer homology domain-containing protein [Solibacillus sp. FSL W7-1464]|uniref:S-layer homology domain-containing protein n=1 Tax=Solibacillus sp. FSL W7-1464 TaxID=2921706 RepID=UPI0030FCAEEE
MAKTNKGRKFFATTATAALVASAIVPVASAAQVNDYNSIASYAQEAVQDLVDRGVVQGDANGNFQPRKSVSRAEAATILTGALGLTTSDNVYFTDVKSGAWYYDAINAAVNNGVFAGKGAGIFEPNGNLTRGEAAIILVNAFNLEGRASLAQFSDEKSVKAWAVESLEIAVGNGVIKGDNGKIGANNAITKQDFAVMFSRAEAAAEALKANTVKVINATTVEVTFPEAVKDVAKLDIAIEGLTISNKVVKQTDAKTVVLTTSAHQAGKEYTVTVDGSAVGKFVGVAEVIPTKIDVTTTSVQGVIGEEVTLTAKVTVPQGQSVENVPVTFNIVNNERTNDKIEAEVLTKADGTATYKYTRYYSSEDTFTAYATKKSSVFSTGKVYWANKIQLAVSDITTATELANGAKKSYKVNGAPNTTYYIAIQENLDVNPDEVKDVDVQTIGGTFVKPRAIKGSNNPVVAEVRTNANGEGAFVVTGSEVSATPIVFATTNGKVYDNKTLQAVGSTVKFSIVDTLVVNVAGEGLVDSAEFTTNPNGKPQNTSSIGGRTYTVTATGKDGKVAPAGSVVYVTFAHAGEVYYATTGNFTPVVKGQIVPLTVGKDGKVQFRVAGKGSDAYVKPTVFMNTYNQSELKFETKDVHHVGETTYFKAPVVANATLKALDSLGRQVSTATTESTVKFVYQSVDQNGFDYKPKNVVISGTQVVYEQQFVGNDPETGNPQYRWVEKTINNTIVENYTLTFDVKTSFNGATVIAGGNTYNLGSSETKTIKLTSNPDGRAEISVNSPLANTITVNATGVGNILPTISASVDFVGNSVLPNFYTGAVEAVNVQAGTLKYQGNYEVVSIVGDNVTYKVGQRYLSSYTEFINALGGPGAILTREVKDGIVTYTIVQAGNVTLDTQLSNLVAQASALNSANYSAASFKAVTDAVSAANALPTTATNAQKQEAINAINAAINSLQKLVNVTVTEAVATGDFFNGTEKLGAIGAAAASTEAVITLDAGKSFPTTNFVAKIGDKEYTATLTNGTWTLAPKDVEGEEPVVTVDTFGGNITLGAYQEALGSTELILNTNGLAEELVGTEYVLKLETGDVKLVKNIFVEGEYSVLLPGNLTLQDVKGYKVEVK